MGLSPTYLNMAVKPLASLKHRNIWERLFGQFRVAPPKR